MAEETLINVVGDKRPSIHIPDKFSRVNGFDLYIIKRMAEETLFNVVGD